MEKKNVSPGTSISLKMMLIYSVASIGANALDSTFQQFSVFFYVNHGLVKNAALIGAAILIGRIVDAVANPLVGYWSDTAFGPRGRRIPYILKGTLPMALAFILFFLPVSKNETFTFIYAALTCSVMLFFFTYVVAPYLALLPDLARSSDDRVKMSTYQALFTIFGIIVGFVVAGLLLKAFMGALPWERAYVAMAAVIGVISVITFYFTAFGIKEKPIKKEERVKLVFWDSVKHSFKNRAFIFYILSIWSFWIGFSALQTSINFVCHKMFGKSEEFGSIFGMGGIILVWLISLPLVFAIQKKWGKRKAFSGALLLISIISFLQGLIGRVPAQYGLIYYLALIFSFGFPFAILLVIYPAILGDVIDLDERTTGFRREAMYFGMEGFFTKISRGLGPLLITVLFSIFGNPSETNHTAMILAGPVCGVFALIGFLFFLKYPIKD